MDSSDHKSSDDHHDYSDHFHSSIELMGSFLLLIIILTVISFCFSHRTRRLPGVLHHHHHHHGGESVQAPGLDDAALQSFPKLLYSKADYSKKLISCNNTNNKVSDYSTALSCSVCLADYDESDVLRVLPYCGHVFHLDCVDSWLRLHPTCPICRKLPSSTSSTSPDSCAISIQIG